MNYEKEYKKLKADIEKAYLFAQTDSTKSVLEHILPELKESEDERTRKEIISFLQLPHPQFVGERKQEKWITWLGKQGGIDNCPLECSTNTVITDSKKNQVKPKFKVGDWVVYEENIYQIHNLSLKKYYECLRTDGTVHIFDFENIDSKSHLWTIQDAKEGDVLVCDDKNKVFLYNGKLDLRGRVCAYCGIYKTYDGLRFTKCAIGNYFTYKEPYPATKEQRDLLFQKMKEFGYEWDDENKGLKHKNK